jgi:hypothetical protein
MNKYPIDGEVCARSSKCTVKSLDDDGALGDDINVQCPSGAWIFMRELGLSMRKLLARLAIISAATLVAVASLAANASAASTPTLHAGSGSIAHTCNVIGPVVDGDEAVVCADLYTGEDGSGDGEVWGQVEAYCQTTSGTVLQCANIEVYQDSYVQTATTANGNYLPDFCGHDYGACPDGRLVTPSTGMIRFASDFGWNSSSCTTDDGYNVWNLALGGTGTTVIQLPTSDANVVMESPYPNDGDNESSGHYDICP